MFGRESKTGSEELLLGLEFRVTTQSKLPDKSLTGAIRNGCLVVSATVTVRAGTTKLTVRAAILLSLGARS